MNITEKMTIELLLADLFVLIVIVCIVLYVVSNAEHNKWAFFITEFGGRFFEFFAVLSMFLMVKRKKAKNKGETSESKEKQSIRQSIDLEGTTDGSINV